MSESFLLKECIQYRVYDTKNKEQVMTLLVWKKYSTGKYIVDANIWCNGSEKPQQEYNKSVFHAFYKQSNHIMTIKSS